MILNTPNYSGRQNNSTSYIKNYILGSPTSLWNIVSYPNSSLTANTLTPSSNVYDNVLIEGDLYVNGKIINPSDANLKDNIEPINIKQINNLMKLKVKQFTFKYDTQKEIHYGFIAQEFEKEFPELVSVKPDKNANYKAINYLEIIPLLVNKIQLMQKEIDELKNNVKLLSI